MIAGHETISSGDVRLGNTVVTDLPPAQRGTAMMFQSYALFPHLDLVDNVAFSLKMKGADKETRRAKALEMLKLMQLEPYATRRPAQLSGGQQQRVALPARSSPTRKRCFWTSRSRHSTLPQDPHACGAEKAPDLARHYLRACDPQPGRGHGAGRYHCCHE